jgi:serine/alanine adding enzyme
MSMTAVANAQQGSADVGSSSTLMSSMIVSALRDEGVAWNRYVEGHPEGTVEHLAEWRTIFADVFGQDPLYLTARRDEQIVGVLPLVRFKSLLFGRSLVSVPYANYAGLLTSDSAASNALVREATTLGRAFGATHVELRNTSRHCSELMARQHKVGARLRLPSTAPVLWTDLDRKVRNQIRKAQKEGLTTELGGAEKLEEFYDVFATNMRDLGTPVFPRRLFSAVFDVFGPRVRLFLVRRGRTTMAAGISLAWRDMVLVPWASSLREYRPLSPNMLLYWSMIESAIASGASVFDFGRSTRGGGTHQFKRQWGAEDVPLHWEYVLLSTDSLPDHGTSNPRMEFFIRTWQRLPVPVTRWLGPHVIRNVP